MRTVPKIPDSTKGSLHLRLAQRARQRWPALTDVQMRYRAGFAYVDGLLTDGAVLPLCRLRYLGSASIWGFVIYRASTTTTKTTSYPAAHRPAAPRKLSTAPAASTSTTPPPGAKAPDESTGGPLADTEARVAYLRPDAQVGFDGARSCGRRGCAGCALATCLVRSMTSSSRPSSGSWIGSGSADPAFG
jgi:hypothetical protein